MSNYINNHIMNNEDSIKKINLIALSRKRIREQFTEWMEKSRKTLQPICLSCAKLDSNNNILGEFNKYTKNMTLIDKQIKEVVEGGGKMEKPISHITFDYKCERGHGITYDYRLKNYEQLKLALKPKGKK